MNEACLQILVTGRVQGVGFRPFVARLAAELGIQGRVCNSRSGVEVRASGEAGALDAFKRRLSEEAPHGARIDSLSAEWRHEAEAINFQIGTSQLQGAFWVDIPADVVPCAACVADMFDVASRRYHYPFTTCSTCGPRDSISMGVPFDRERTTMVDFPWCGECRREYEDLENRRYHAETISCPQCGPLLEWTDEQGRALASGGNALEEAVLELRAGGVIAVKGIGGFQLLCCARNESAIMRLRDIKRRPSKPLAVMVRDIAAARELAWVSAEEADLLGSPAAPIVLLPSRLILPGKIAPGLDTLGVLLPASPLHILLACAFGGPIVVTSGNRTDEPMPVDVIEARERISGCRRFLTHDRRIERGLDDSVVRVAFGQSQVLRRARGLSAEPVRAAVDGGILAFGAHLKNTVALTSPGTIWVSPHIGDLDSVLSRDRVRREIALLSSRCSQRVTKIALDQHPDYGSTQLAMEWEMPNVRLQHHEAHAWACAAELGIAAPWLAVTWDGFGLGNDGTLWGGESWLLAEGKPLERIASLRPFQLPSGSAREPRRSLLGIAHAIGYSGWGERLARHFSGRERLNLERWLATGGGLSTSSVGRLFDAMACLLLGRGTCDYEGQAAMELESVARQGVPPEELRFELNRGLTPWSIDWEPFFSSVVERLEAGADARDLAAGFHFALSQIIVRMAEGIGQRQVLLTGGVFQNRLLLEMTVSALKSRGFEPLWPRAFPPHDGGISLGQAFLAARRDDVSRDSR